MFGRRDGETQREVGLPHARRPEQHDILFALDEAERVETLDLLPLHARLETEIEIGEGLHDGESRRAHRGLEPSCIAELNVRTEELLDRVGRADLPGVTAAENVIKRFERAGHLEVGELRAQPLSQRLTRRSSARTSSRANATHSRAEARDGAARLRLDDLTEIGRGWLNLPIDREREAPVSAPRHSTRPTDRAQCGHGIRP